MEGWTPRPIPHPDALQKHRIVRSQENRKEGWHTYILNVRRSNSYQSRKCALVKTEENSIRAENALLPPVPQPGVKGRGPLPWILCGLVALSKSQTCFQLAFTASGVIGWFFCLTMAPRARSQRTGHRNKTKTPSTEFKRDTESKIHLSLLNFFLF